MKTRVTLALALALTVGLGACDDPTGLGGFRSPGGDNEGVVFTSSNSPDGNSVLTFRRDADGALSPAGSIPTEGLGTGGGLGNQGAMLVTPSRRWLLVVNAGSDDVSVIRLDEHARTVSRVPSGGTRPISLDLRGSLVYVLNGGGTENVSGFRLGLDGTLTPIPGAIYPLSEAQVGSAQVGFSPDGRSLVVTEKATNRILVFPVRSDGRLGTPRVERSSGDTPFGFAFDRRGNLVVSEAFGGAPGASVLSSYRITQAGGLQVVTPEASAGETAACWVVISRDGRFAFTTNTGSHTISGFGLAAGGELTLQDRAAATLADGAAPIDMGITRNGRFLYVLNSGTLTLGAYKVGSDGSLQRIEGGGAMGLPMGTNGLVAL